MRLAKEGLPARLLAALVLLMLAGVVVLALAGSHKLRGADPGRAAGPAVVREMRLSDLALWTGTSYCRHPSLADGFASRSTHPSALEHFPAGSLVPPPSVNRTGRPRETGRGGS